MTGILITAGMAIVTAFIGVMAVWNARDINERHHHDDVATHVDSKHSNC